MNNMIIETLKRLSINVFVTIMAIGAIGITHAAISLLINQFWK